MTYEEALRTLGLEDGATEADIKSAYREMAQILHPDKFADNRKLQERAEEQFKHVNEARDVLIGAAKRRSGKAGATATGATGSTEQDRAAALKARLLGIQAVRVQLTAQLDHELDSRRVGIGLGLAGLIGFIIGERSGMRLIDALGGTALIWGVIQFFSAQANIKAVRTHLARLDKERKLCEQQLEEL